MQELLSNPYLLPVCIFVAAALGLWSIADIFVVKSTESEERLRRIQGISPGAAVNEAKSKRREEIKQWVEKTSSVLADSVKPKTEKEANQLRQQLSYAGLRTDSAQSIYLATKVALLIGGTIFGLLGVGIFSDGTAMWWVMGMAVGLLMFFLPGIVLNNLIKSRKQQIVLSMPDCLDLLVVCVEAGLGLDHAMRKVSEEMAETNPVLSYEISLTNMHLQMGRTREESLQDLSDRNGAEELTSLAQMLIQADRFGTSIAQALRVQSEALRIKRRQKAEEKASKTAVQLLFPLVLFIFPGIFVVLVGPAAINIIEGFLNT
ncbi:MAG: type II secretion system F family protein [Planctomycetaceae bacterium]|nr:type II secretion system F family protein [Planctomycetaceae bacterium]